MAGVVTKRNGTKVNPLNYDDWFMPSRDELNAMYVNLKLYNVGGFVNVWYWSSSEYSATEAYYIFFGGSSGHNRKAEQSGFVTRPCRSFEGEVGEYSIRDTGPAGGLIFAYDNGLYYEAAPITETGNLGTRYIAWTFGTPPNETSIGTTGTAIGTGKANTLSIINQQFHTISQAKFCNDYSV